MAILERNLKKVNFNSKIKKYLNKKPKNLNIKNME